MDRTELAILVNPKAAPRPIHEAGSPLREKLAAHFASPAGQSDLMNAPRVNGRQITAAEAVDALIEESKGL